MGLLVTWSERKSKREKILGKALRHAMGWCFTLAILTMAYNAGRWLAPHIGWSSEPSIFGLLTAIAFVWMNTFIEFHGRCDRLSDRIDQLEESASN
jgi:hypothetical protein